MKTIKFNQLDETLYHEKMDNGLQVYLLPKKGFSKTYATFTTNYGSIDRKFVPINEQDAIEVPDGIAHFLEHKLFEKEDGDVFHHFSEKGGSANAFTSFTRTAYLFSATNHIETHVKTLLDFVQEPYFSEKTVEKEKGIIAQEISMYDDMPDWRLYFGAIENMYEHTPVNIDIAGTRESIQEITAEHLYTCYHTFYHPSNMVFFIVGNIDPEKMMTFIRENQQSKEFVNAHAIDRIVEQEKSAVHMKERTLEMDVQKPKVLIGLKSSVTDLIGEEMMKHELGMQIGLDCLFGKSSTFYEELYEEGIIDESYGADFTLERGFGFAMIGSDTSQPQQFIERVIARIDQLSQDNLLNEEDIQRAIRKKIGFFLRALNSIEFIANQFTRYQFNQMDLFQVVPTLENMTIEDVQNSIKAILGKEKQTVFQILPHVKETNG